MENKESDNEEDEWMYGNASQLRQVKSNNSKDDLLYNLKFLINNEVRTIETIIDTGAHLNCVGYEYLKKLWGKKRLILEDGKEIIHDYSGNKIKVFGEKTIRCRHKQKNFDFVFQVSMTPCKVKSLIQ